MNKAEQATWYAEQLAQYGPDDARAVGWGGGYNSQRMRFCALVRGTGMQSGRSILDVGCGLGDFYGHLHTTGLLCSAYTGIDVSPEMIEAARAKYGRGYADWPKPEFRCLDILGDDWQELPGEYDYVVCSGMFTHCDDMQMWMALQHMWDKTRVAMAFNCLSELAPYQYPHEYYHPVGRLLNSLLVVTPYIAVDHSYCLHDFTVTLWREARG